jgi:hypothetical protein
MNKNDTWVVIGGQRQRASELPYELRKKLGIEDEPAESPEKKKIEHVRREPESKYVKAEDSNLDTIARIIGRELGLLMKWFNKPDK